MTVKKGPGDMEISGVVRSRDRDKKCHRDLVIVDIELGREEGGMSRTREPRICGGLRSGAGWMGKQVRYS